MGDNAPKKRWRVETRATVFRVYFVDAIDEKDAEAASWEISEDENEETISIMEDVAVGESGAPK